MDSKTFQDAASDAVEDVIGVLDTGRFQSPLPSPDKLDEPQPLDEEALPLEPAEWPLIRTSIHEDIIGRHTKWNSERFFAYFPANFSYESVVAEMYATALNSPGFNWLASPAMSDVEDLTTEWVAQAMDLPEGFRYSSGTGGGVLHTSATEGILVAMTSARERFLQKCSSSRDSRCRPYLVALGGHYTHTSSEKVAMIAGVDFVKCGTDVDGGYCVKSGAWLREIQRLEKEERQVFFITATIGTTSTCAVDPLEDLEEIKRLYPHIWIHIDAAYAGSALICLEQRNQAKAKYLRFADSFGVNLHKWLFISIEASCFFTQDRAAVEGTMSLTPSYLQDPGISQTSKRQLKDWQLSYGRRFRAMKLYITFRSMGVETLRDKICKHIEYAVAFQKLCDSPTARECGIRVVTAPRFALLVITFDKPERPDSCRDLTWREIRRGLTNFGFEDTLLELEIKRRREFSKRVFETTNRRRRFFVTQVELDGVFGMRIATANDAITEATLRELLDEVILAVREEWDATACGHESIA